MISNNRIKIGIITTNVCTTHTSTIYKSYLYSISSME